MGMKRHVRLLRIEIEKFILFFSDFSYGQEIESWYFGLIINKES